MTTTADVPGLLPCAIDGHAYLCEAEYQRQTVPVMRQQSDTSTEAGEQSLNPQGLWRRSQESWHHGAGQDFLDGRMGDTPPDPHRFRASKGIDCWTKGQVSLLHPTIKSWSTSNSNLHLAVASGIVGVPALYVSDGTALYWSDAPFGGFNTLALGIGTGWTPTNATIATSQVTRFTLTATSGAAVSATSPTGLSGAPVDPGRSYLASVSAVYVSGGAGKLVQIAVKWYDDTGALISTEPTVTGTTDATAGSATLTATAPSTAAFAALVVSWSTNFANGEIHRVYAANIAPSDTVGAVVPDNWKTADIQAGEAAQTVQSITTDGTYVWAALGSSGLHRTLGWTETSTANVPAAPAVGQISQVSYCAPFLLAAGSAGTASTRENTLWNVTDPLGTPALSVIKTHDNPTFKWAGMASGRNCVYAWGNNSSNGEIYKIMFDPNTGTLATAASPATSWPDGETIHSLVYYAGTVILGTGKGVRIGTIDGAGNIDYGGFIPTDWPVRCLEPQDRYCWFGWTQYDTSNSGLGRIDLGFQTDTLTPAWASDLMTLDSSSGEVVAAVTITPYGYSFSQRPPVRVFTVAGEGVYVEDAYFRVTSGFLETGTVRFSTSEPKTTRSLDIRHHALPSGGQISALMYLDGTQLPGSVGESLTPDSFGPASPIDLDDLSAEAMEFSFALARPDPDDLDFTRSPEMTRWTAKVLPTPSTVDEVFTLKLVMKEYIVAANGTKRYQDVPGEVTYLKGLERSREIVEFQVGSETFEGYVAQTQWTGANWNNPKREFAEGDLVVQMQTVNG